MTSNSPKRFHKSFTQQEPLPESAIESAVAVLRSGRLHRYNHTPDEQGETARLEHEFAEYVGRKYCLACASCGSAIYLAMKSLGVGAGETVLCNAFTLAPVPGAIEQTGADVQFIDITDDFTIDFDHLDRIAKAS